MALYSFFVPIQGPAGVSVSFKLAHGDVSKAEGQWVGFNSAALAIEFEVAVCSFVWSLR